MKQALTLSSPAVFEKLLQTVCFPLIAVDELKSLVRCSADAVPKTNAVLAESIFKKYRETKLCGTENAFLNLKA